MTDIDGVQKAIDDASTGSMIDSVAVIDTMTIEDIVASDADHLISIYLIGRVQSDAWRQILERLTNEIEKRTNAWEDALIGTSLELMREWKNDYAYDRATMIQLLEELLGVGDLTPAEINAIAPRDLPPEGVPPRVLNITKLKALAKRRPDVAAILEAGTDKGRKPGQIQMVDRTTGEVTAL